MSKSETRQDRCIRNERKLDGLEKDIHIHGERLLKIDLAIESIAGKVVQLESNQRHIIDNELKHTPTYDETFIKNKTNVAILVALITAISTIVTAICYNLDAIVSLIKTVIGAG